MVQATLQLFRRVAPTPPGGRQILAEARQAPPDMAWGFIHIFEERCIASSFCFRFAPDRRFIAAPPPTKHAAMVSTDSNVLKLAPDAATPAYRSAPHNIEAEQSLLGAILVNNDAFYRVSDFLEPKHFFEPLHQTIYETAGSLIRMGKVATPVTLKTFLPADADIGGMTV